MVGLRVEQSVTFHSGISKALADVPSRYFPGYSGPLSLYITQWVGTMSTALAMFSAIVGEEMASSV